MKFEFDTHKSKSNKKKHGIDFVEAQALWEDPELIEISTKVKVIDEPIFLVIAKLGEKHWSGIIAYHSENIRIISVRRARQEEADVYES